jgi:hypothetical protein
MKKITLLAVAFVALTAVSCKKDRTCTCTTTTTSTSSTSGSFSSSYSGPFNSTENKTTLTKVSKKTAKANCVSNEDTKVVTDPDGDTNTTMTKKDCSLS